MAEQQEDSVSKGISFDVYRVYAHGARTSSVLNSSHETLPEAKAAAKRYGADGGRYVVLKVVSTVVARYGPGETLDPANDDPEPPSLLEAVDAFDKAVKDTVASLNAQGIACPAGLALAAEKARNAARQVRGEA